MHLFIITPTKTVVDTVIHSIVVPTVRGEITILPKHAKIITQLTEGIVSYTTTQGKELSYAVGEGFVQTDGKQVKLLVSRAYGQDEIDEKFTAEAIALAKKRIAEAPDTVSRAQALSAFRRSTIDMKLVRKRKHRIV